MSEEMKKLVIDGTEFEVVDAAGRDRITVLENTTPSGGGLSITEKNLILQLFSKAAYSEDDAGDAFDALSALWSGSAYSVAWDGTGYTHGNSAVTIEEGETFTSTITANNGKTIESVTVLMGGEIVQGAYSGGTITIPNVTGNIVITVTTAQMTVSSISAVYTQSGTVYNTDSLDSLKANLVVTATFPDSSTAVIPASDYTLSGTLLEGTSSITVSYGGKTAAFNVTVTSVFGDAICYWDLTSSLTDLVSQNTATLGGNASQTSAGLSLTEATDYAVFPNLMNANRRIEVDIASINRKGSSHARLFMYNKGAQASPDVTSGFIYRMSQRYWAFYRTSWITTSYTDDTLFDGKTATITLDANKVMTVSVDGTDIVSSGQAINIASDDNSLYIGSPSGNSAFDTVITGIRVYEDE